ncbi:MAG: GlxA family transcriptional regulator [Maritimibacter sp.]
MTTPPPEALSPVKHRRMVFVLMAEFTLLSFSAALDSLRIANRLAGFEAYTWLILSEDGAPLRSSAGIEVCCDGGLEALRHDDTIVLCGGLNASAHSTPKLIAWLRREARRGTALIGLCTASYTLAKAGLLDGKRATIHWENQDGFEEDFPDVTLSKRVFVIDGNRITAAGGTAAMDLMLTLIARDLGQEVANGVADQEVYTAIRTDRDVQRLSVPTRIGVRHPKLASVIQTMETHIEEPISPAILARDVGLSTRQLERLFRRYLNRSPKRYYMELRLQKARNLLLQTDMNVMNVALACGFSSPSHFSKCYRAHYDTTPYRERGSRAGAP